MKKITYVCDMCGKEITEKIMKIDIKCVDKETGGILDFDAYEECKELEDEKHLCQDCVKKIIKRKNNTGDYNTGRCNTGDYNTGDYNTGDFNTGDFNTGDFNTGDFNIGNCNTGECNTGHYNTGDFNMSAYNTGCFCTDNHKILLFDRISDMTMDEWKNSEARMILSKINLRKFEWIKKIDMTDEEKEEHPEYETIGGYLKTRETGECYREWWNNLSYNEKNIIMDIQNFDKEKFKKITGIDVDE